MADDLTILANSPDKDGDSDVIKSPVIKALRSHFNKYNGESTKLFNEEVLKIRNCEHEVHSDTLCCVLCGASAELIMELR